MAEGAAAAAVEALPLGELIGRLVRGIERGGKHWTVARRKDSLQRVLAGSRDPQRLQQRLAQLLANWEDDGSAAKVEIALTEPAPLDAIAPATAATAPPARAGEVSAAAGQPHAAPARAVDDPPHAVADVQACWPRVNAAFADTLHAALPPAEPRAQALLAELRALRDALAAGGATAPLAGRADAWGERARRLLAHRHHLMEQLGTLTHELSAGIVELAEDESWARGQAETMREKLRDGVSARSVRSVSQLLERTRERQRALRGERAAARDALKAALETMLHEVGELGTHTERFDDRLSNYADVIRRADSLQAIADTVREMVEQTASVRTVVKATRERLAGEHARAGELAARVQTLEDELRRLSDEVSTDPLTGVANRRGLLAAFEAETARAERSGEALAIGLIDIDDFKRLNDSLGHAAGDQALVALAQQVRDCLRPSDSVARFGGEEFVVLLPGIDAAQARETLTRLQRQLSAGLFLHDKRPVLVTFSAGVTAVQCGERIEQALERADEALYEAKRSGKNRTCIA